MDMLGLKEAADKLARANGVKWHSHVLKRAEEDVLIKAMVHEVNGKRKQRRPKMKWRKQVEGNMRKISLRKEDMADRCKWREGVRRVAEVVECFQPPPVFFFFRPFPSIRGCHSVSSFSKSSCLQPLSPSHRLPPYLL